MVMEKPLCRLCHSRHYATEEHVFSGTMAKASVRAPRTAVRRNATGNVTTMAERNVSAERNITPLPRNVTMARIEELEAEVAMLKRQLAKANQQREIGGS